MKLCQVLALEKGTKQKTLEAITAIHRETQDTAKMSGVSKAYRPLNEDGERELPEVSYVQVRAEDSLKAAGDALAKLFDITATKDYTNCNAKADVVIAGLSKPLIAGAPVPYLLWLEKQLNDVHTLVSKAATLDASEKWTFDGAQNCWATEPVDQYRTKKIPRNHVLSEATDKHPAQVQVFTEDVPVGVRTTTKFSGAIPRTRKAEILARIEALQAAVKVAREEANATESVAIKTGDPVFAYLFA